MLRKAIEFACEIAQENLVNRGVDSLLDSLSGKDNSDSDVENMESNFNSLMARAVDVDKEISIKLEQGRKKRKKEVEAWFKDVKKVEGEYRAFVEEEERKGLLKKIFGGDEAIKLNARICSLTKWSRFFGGFVVDDRITGMPRPTTGLEGAAFQDNFERIFSLLENDKVSSIGVHGMGGVGKSTLVEHIYNQLLGRNKCVFWVVVSFERCSIKMLQDKIARKLFLDLSDEDDDEGARAGRLNHALSQRENFVLILDDVWERIDLVKVGIPLSLKGCKWMITSRSLKVCQEMNCQEKIAIEPLLEDEGWNLFLGNLGRDATLALRNPEVEGIAKRMVEICDGLPLGIITVAGAVSGVTEIQEWRHEVRVLEESIMGHEWMEEKVFRVLKYSFDRLNLNDQRCFLYCALYPEDCEISRERLVTNLISEKLVDEKKSRIAQSDEGHSIVTRLVKVSLLESGYDSDWGYHFVKMHDLVREMALKITKGKTMVIAGHSYNRKEIPIEEEWTKGLEKVSFMRNSIKEIPDGISPNCPKLTTLILRENPLKRIAASFFTQMCGLRTLDLSETDIEELPDSVSELLNLTSLLLGGCENLVRVPCVGKLKELRELDLSETTIRDVPEGIEELRLRLLLLPLSVEMELVEIWERLEVYRGRVKHMSDFNRLVASKHDGVSYFILLGFYDIYCDNWEYDGVTRALFVSEYDLKGGEENELTTILADYIQFLKFTSCDLSKSLLDNLSNPTSLQALTISRSEGIECMLTYEQYKAPQGSKSPFQALQVIDLYDLDDFMGVIHNLEIESDPPPSPSSVFSSLRRLEILQCHEMKKLGLPLSIFEKLEYVSIRWCGKIEKIIQVSAANESDDALFVSLPNLKQLCLVNLPSLESFFNATVICNSLEEFELKECPRLQAPFLNWGTTDSYKALFPGNGVDEIRRDSL